MTVRRILLPILNLRPMARPFANVSLAPSMPIVLLGHAYWDGLMDWLGGTVLGSGNISAPDPGLVTVTDDVEEAVAIATSLIVPTRPGE